VKFSVISFEHPFIEYERVDTHVFVPVINYFIAANPYIRKNTPPTLHLNQEEKS
jgi:hypothetical protein